MGRSRSSLTRATLLAITGRSRTGKASVIPCHALIHRPCLRRLSMRRPPPKHVKGLAMPGLLFGRLRLFVRLCVSVLAATDHLVAEKWWIGHVMASALLCPTHVAIAVHPKCSQLPQ